MATPTLGRIQGQARFDPVLHEPGGVDVEIELPAPDVVAQVESNAAPITGRSCHPRNDLPGDFVDTSSNPIGHARDICRRGRRGRPAQRRDGRHRGRSPDEQASDLTGHWRPMSNRSRCRGFRIEHGPWGTRMYPGTASDAVSVAACP